MTPSDVLLREKVSRSGATDGSVERHMSDEHI